jgi:hypothetical protein
MNSGNYRDEPDCAPWDCNENDAPHFARGLFAEEATEGSYHRLNKPGKRQAALKWKARPQQAKNLRQLFGFLIRWGAPK